MSADIPDVWLIQFTWIMFATSWMWLTWCLPCRPWCPYLPWSQGSRLLPGRRTEKTVGWGYSKRKMNGIIHTLKAFVWYSQTHTHPLKDELTHRCGTLASSTVAMVTLDRLFFIPHSCLLAKLRSVLQDFTEIVIISMKYCTQDYPHHHRSSH